MIDKEALTEFKELYFQEYRVELTDEQALDYGTRLVGLVKAVYGKDLPSLKSLDKEDKKANN